MITAYRIVKQKWADSAFDGEGARLYGGRWNSTGRPCIYLAGSESLAILEILVHLNSSKTIEGYVLYSVEIDETSTMFLSVDNLPDNWQEDPAPQETAEIGDDWLAENESVALAVPSTIVTREQNYIINTNHPQFDEILETVKQLELAMDKRLV